MAIQYPSFSGSDWNTGIPDMAKAINSGLQNFKTLQEGRIKANEAKYAPQMSEADLKAKALSNAINEIKSKYEEQNQKANLEHLQATTGLTRGQLSLIPYQQRHLLAQITGEESKSGLSATKQKLLNNILSGQFGSQLGGASNVSEPSNVQQNMAGQGMFPQENNQQPITQPQQNNVGQSKPNMNYAQAIFAAKALGMGEPKIIDVNGTKTAVTPFGNIPIAQGLTKLQENLSKEDAKSIKSFEDSYGQALEKKDTFTKLNDVIANPLFEKMRQHPISGSYELKAYKLGGTAEEKKLVSDYETYTGQIIKDASRDFRGSFRVGEQRLLEAMKPTISDSFEAAKAKAEALTYMNEMLLQRSKIAAQLMRHQGLSKVDALDQADKMFNGDQVRDAIKKQLNPKQKQYSQSDLEFTARKYNMTVDQVKQKLGV